MFSSDCAITMKQPQIDRRTQCTRGKLAINGGKEVCRGLLFLPQFGCGVLVKTENYFSANKFNGLTEETFEQLSKELGCSQKITVQVPLDLAKVIDREKGQFQGMKRYQEICKSDSPLQRALKAVEDQLFSVVCEKI